MPKEVYKREERETTVRESMDLARMAGLYPAGGARILYGGVVRMCVWEMPTSP